MLPSKIVEIKHLMITKPSLANNKKKHTHTTQITFCLVFFFG